MLRSLRCNDFLITHMLYYVFDLLQSTVILYLFPYRTMFPISFILQRHVKNIDMSRAVIAITDYDGGLIVYNYDTKRDYDS